MTAHHDQPTPENPETPPGAAGAPAPPPPQGATVPDVPLDLRRPRHRVDPKARHVWRIDALLGWLLLIVPAALLTWLVEESRPWSTGVLIGVLVVASAHAAIMPEWAYRVHRWEVDDEAVHTLVGWITQTARVAPVSRIQTVDSAYGPIQRLFGLGTLTVTTASAAGPLKIDGIPRAQVEELVSRLTEVTSRDGGDAT